MDKKRCVFRKWTNKQNPQAPFLLCEGFCLLRCTRLCADYLLTWVASRKDSKTKKCRQQLLGYPQFFGNTWQLRASASTRLNKSHLNKYNVLPCAKAHHSDRHLNSFIKLLRWAMAICKFWWQHTTVLCLLLLVCPVNRIVGKWWRSAFHWCFSVEHKCPLCSTEHHCPSTGYK